MYNKQKMTYRGWSIIQYSLKDNEDKVFYRIPMRDADIECECWADVVEYIDNIIDGDE